MVRTMQPANQVRTMNINQNNQRESPVHSFFSPNLNKRSIKYIISHLMWLVTILDTIQPNHTSFYDLFRAFAHKHFYDLFMKPYIFMVTLRWWGGVNNGPNVKC